MGKDAFDDWIWLQAAQLKAHGKRLLCRCKADVIRDGHFRLHLTLNGHSLYCAIKKLGVENSQMGVQFTLKKCIMFV